MYITFELLQGYISMANQGVTPPSRKARGTHVRSLDLVYARTCVRTQVFCHTNLNK